MPMLLAKIAAMAKAIHFFKVMNCPVASDYSLIRFATGKKNMTVGCFSSVHKHSRITSLISVSSPYVEGAWIPAVATALVHAVSVPWQIRILALAHKIFAARK